MCSSPRLAKNDKTEKREVNAKPQHPLRIYIRFKTQREFSIWEFLLAAGKKEEEEEREREREREREKKRKESQSCLKARASNDWAFRTNTSKIFAT